MTSAEAEEPSEPPEPPPEPGPEPTPESPPGPSPGRSESPRLRLTYSLLALTVSSGMIDAVSFLGLHNVFTANMTGNVVVLGFATAGAKGFSVAHTATSIGCFVAGAVGGGRLAGRLAAHPRGRWARASLALEAALLLAAAIAAFTLPDDAVRPYVLLAVTALAMGMRNATVRKLGVPGIATTTVVTTTLTALLSDSPLGGGRGEHGLLRAAAVLSLFCGALLGAWLYLDHGLGVPLLVVALLAALLAVTTSGRD
ncbi:YoaK family protein [Streptomyces sp. NPDC091377]|uniref:YoaK family protein n=1 Tax=unclassified Streptomyces TaxID=2593676 RepID=UPI003822FF82